MFSISKKLLNSITKAAVALPKKVLEQSQISSHFLKVNKFKPDSNPMTLNNLYGIHRDDIDLTITYVEKDNTQTLWRFVSSNYIPRTAYFVNKEGQIRLFDFTDPAEIKRLTRMDVVN